MIYSRVASGATPRLKPAEITNVVDKLSQSLRETHAFSEKHEFSVFTQNFADALDTLDSRGKNLHRYHQHLAPDGFLSAEATAILDAAQSAWVFGGMGSWNDLGFDGDDQKEYVRVSEQLFLALNEAIAAGANSTYKRIPGER